MGKSPTFVLLFGLALASQPATASAAPGANKMETPLSMQGVGTKVFGSQATTASGQQIIVARLTTDPVEGDSATIEAEQQAFLARCLQLPNTRLVARTRFVLNAVFLAVDRAHIAEIAADPAVSRVSQVGNYSVDLTETVPYIGASALQGLGVDGTGVRVAVLDSGIDYLHADLGGSGSVADYESNNRDVVEPGSFPTQKVVGGFDFVGEVWPNGDLAPDPDPLDFEGHGTHVADIIGGNLGVAPGVDLYAVKVCSAVSSSCSGVALIQGMDFSVDPNGDGDPSDHVDIINMSLGSVYGQPFDDDLVAAVENATKFGVLTVASAGNSGDAHYATGTPAAAASAISVAQTSVPSAVQDRMEVTAPAADAGLYNAVFQPWSTPLSGVIQGTAVYGDGAGGNLDGCAAFTTSLAGQIVFVDRGGCFFSDKIQNIEDAGGVLGIIGLITPEEPFAGGFGGGRLPGIPGFMISQAAGDIIRNNPSNNIAFDPANGIPLAGSMASSSSRGPRNGDNLLKPEIGAPGASISAEATTGVTRTPFGGTSGAAPMVAGAAALLKETRPWANPWEIKTLLLNNADTMVARDFTGVPAEVTRIGAGEVNAFAACEASVKVNEYPWGRPSLSMGYEPISKSRQVIRKKVQIVNDKRRARTFDISSSFRFENDAASNAISVQHPSRVRVPGWGLKTFTVKFVINGENLPTSSLTSGVEGNIGAILTATEYDGYITISDHDDSVDMPWHIIPRKSANVRAPRRLRLRGGTANVTLNNRGVGPANNDAFTLLALSDDIPEGGLGEQAPTPDIRGVGVRTTPVPAGFCSANESFLLEFAFTSWEPQTHLVPVIFSALIDADNDGTPDFDAFNADFNVFTGDPGLDGRSVAIAADLAAESQGAFFFTNHATNTANTIITYCAEQFGFTPADLGTKDITVTFSANDFYFGGPGDTLAPVTFTLGGGYSATVPDMDPNTTATMTVTDNGGTSPDLGIMLLTNGDRGSGNRGGATMKTEAQFLTTKGHGHKGRRRWSWH